MTTRDAALTLNQTIAALGYTKKRAGASWNLYDMHIMKDGKIVFTGDSVATWAWLRSTKQLT